MFVRFVLLVILLGVPPTALTIAAIPPQGGAANLVLCCHPDNDLYRAGRDEKLPAAATTRRPRRCVRRGRGLAC